MQFSLTRTLATLFSALARVFSTSSLASDTPLDFDEKVYGSHLIIDHLRYLSKCYQTPAHVKSLVLLRLFLVKEVEGPQHEYLVLEGRTSQGSTVYIGLERCVRLEQKTYHGSLASLIKTSSMISDFSQCSFGAPAADSVFNMGSPQRGKRDIILATLELEKLAQPLHYYQFVIMAHIINRRYMNYTLFNKNCYIFTKAMDDLTKLLIGNEANTHLRYNNEHHSLIPQHWVWRLAVPAGSHLSTPELHELYQQFEEHSRTFRTSVESKVQAIQQAISASNQREELLNHWKEELNRREEMLNRCYHEIIMPNCRSEEVLKEQLRDTGNSSTQERELEPELDILKELRDVVDGYQGYL